MRIWIMAPLGAAMLVAACGETQMQRIGTGAGGGALAGAVVGGPIGALAGAGIGAAGGAYRDRIDDTVDEGAGNVAEAMETDSGSTPAMAATREPTTAREREPIRFEDESRQTRAGRQQWTPAMTEGDLSNDEVREAQTALRDLGLYDGEIDGLYGRRTIAAVGEFQTRENLPRTGALNERTQQQLASAATDGRERQPATQEQGSEARTGAPADDERPTPATSE